MGRSRDHTLADVLVVSGARTPVGRYGGALSGVRPDDLLACALGAAIRASGVPAAEVDEVVAGCANQAGEDSRNVARMASLLAGVPAAVPGRTVNRLCGSGLAAVTEAFRQIALGDADVVVAGGVESMSRSPYVLAKPQGAPARGVPAMHDSALGWRFPNPRMFERFGTTELGVTAENLARRYRVSRAAQDEFALRSHELALSAWERGDYHSTVVPVPTPEGAVQRDDGPRSDTSREKLAALRPAFVEEGSVTAGNSSPLSDGAAAVVLASPAACDRYLLRPVARIVATGQVGVHPDYMGIGPVLATQKAARRAGWTVAGLDAIELNEAFAVQCLAVLSELGVSDERVNGWGGAIALGHPLGMSGVRLILTLVSRLRRTGGGRGAATACVGVGQGETILLECS